MLRILIILLCTLFGLALVGLLAVSLLRLPLDLSAHKPLIESTVSKSLGRNVKIDGSITVTTSMWPYFEVQNLRISNPPGFSGGTSDADDMAKMGLARVTLGLLPLLQRRIVIREFRVSDIEVDLITDTDGDANWLFDKQASEQENKEDSATVTDADIENALPRDRQLNSISIDKIVLEEIRINWMAAGAPTATFDLDRADGGAPHGEPMHLDMSGALLEELFTLKLRASSLAGFLAMTQAELEAEFDIAATRLVFSGRSDALRANRTSSLKFAINGANLSSLNQLLRLDLPPIQDYGVTADLLLTPLKFELSALEAVVKDSKLKGTAVIDRRGEHPIARINLTADTIQLQDFDTGDWTANDDVESAVEPPGNALTKPANTGTEDTVQNPQKLLSGEALQRSDVELSIKVGEVRSQEDFLGSADLNATLKNGRIELAPLKLKLPKASLQVNASLKPGKVASEASLRVKIDNFDFGVLSRLSNPDSKVGGIVSVDLDVESKASNVNLMAGANGYFDVLAMPTGLQSGLVDLWAVNLLSSVVSSASKDKNVSEVNCMISRFRIENGVMTAEQVAVDTSRIRICGTGKVSFAAGNFNLVATPKAKRAEFFGLATPLKVKGEFDDFRVSMKGGALTLGATAVNFAISPVTTPFKRLFQGKLPADGADICSLPIGARTQELEPVPGC